jgi:hypothetical protein
VTNIHQQNAHGTGPGARLGLGQAASAGAVEAAEGALRSEEEEAYLRSCAAAAGALPESAEETAAYLAARKRAFPTAQHVQRKARRNKRQRRAGRRAGCASGDLRAWVPTFVLRPRRFCSAAPPALLRRGAESAVVRVRAEQLTRGPRL